MAGLIGLDFETYGAVDLPKHGLHRYVNDKSFMPLIGSVKWRTPGNMLECERLDFVDRRKQSTRDLRELIGAAQIVAHNAPFEEQVLIHLGLDYPVDRFIDSAVVARVAGGGSRLEAAAPQLLDTDKVAAGRHLMRLFSIKGEYQEKSGSPLFDPQVIADHLQEWGEYGDYCDVDAELGLLLVEKYMIRLTPREREYMAITQEMNRVGWPVDVPLVEEMQRRYLENQDQALEDFRVKYDAHDLNLNSLKQLKEWCADRGIKATSFAEKPLEKMGQRIDKKIMSMAEDDPKQEGYAAVLDLIQTKQILGGSSLKKLQVILDTATPDHWSGGYRLKDQYLHCGAGQTLRTTGRSVQMQNLKRLSVVADMDELEDLDVEWDNTKLAENLRQVFTASEKGGRLIVGDFSSVESRGLAYLAGETWKLLAYRQGKDLYKVTAGKIYTIDYDDVTKVQRQTGKVGELSCGYGAGSGAVVSFAAGMGVEMTEAEASKLVWDWRDANPNIVTLWAQLDDMLKRVGGGTSHYEKLQLQEGMSLLIEKIDAPDSLQRQVPGIHSVKLTVLDSNNRVFLIRLFHGTHSRGRNICYFKPSDRKTGDLWRDTFVDPKTKQVRNYEIYGGKLAGILTQSFCRELFMQSLAQVHKWCQSTRGQITLVGQFHDEIVLDWKPGAISLDEAKADLEALMSDPGGVVNFPLAADIKDDYRYTK